MITNRKPKLNQLIIAYGESGLWICRYKEQRGWFTKRTGYSPITNYSGIILDEGEVIGWNPIPGRNITLD